MGVPALDGPSLPKPLSLDHTTRLWTPHAHAFCGSFLFLSRHTPATAALSSVLQADNFQIGTSQTPVPAVGVPALDGPSLPKPLSLEHNTRLWTPQASRLLRFIPCLFQILLAQASPAGVPFLSTGRCRHLPPDRPPATAAVSCLQAGTFQVGNLHIPAGQTDTWSTPRGYGPHRPHTSCDSILVCSR